MTTYITFAPSASPSAPPFQFEATLDGAVYTITAQWNFAAQRWYITIVDQFGNLVVNRPLVGSPPLTALSSLSWSAGLVTAVAPSFMGYRRGSLVNISITGASPAPLAGVFPCTIIGPSTFTYPLANNPGQILTPGSWSTDINLAAGYFETSTLVFRAATQNFEIS